MNIINGKDIIDAGYPAGPLIGEMLSATREYEARGINNEAYILKLLRKKFQPPAPKLQMCEQAAPLAQAITATCPEDEKNITKVCLKMGELLRTPIISQGAIMPDACPAGMAPATIPVGGVIAVENAIIPSAHSADVCCSMFATFYEPQLSVAEEIDALLGVTRFGPGGREIDDLVHHPVLDEDVWDNPFLSQLEHKAKIHIADQGDGNHFAYIGEVSFDKSQISLLKESGHTDIADQLQCAELKVKSYRVIVTHHGSRALGAHLYKRGQKAALKETARLARDIPKAAAWLPADSEVGRDYWEALQYVGRWTRGNHEAIHTRFMKAIETKKVADFGNEHNFVWKRGDTYFHGKGATPAWKDDKGRPLLGLIPLNMGAPIFNGVRFR